MKTYSSSKSHSSPVNQKTTKQQVDFNDNRPEISVVRQLQVIASEAYIKNSSDSEKSNWQPPKFDSYEDQTPGSNSGVVQRAWKSADSDGLVEWDTLLGGLQWFFNLETQEMYFECDDPSIVAEPEVLEYEGEGSARNYSKWILLWMDLDILSSNEAGLRLVVPALTEDNEEYSEDDQMGLMDFVSNLEGTQGVQYLLNEFNKDPEVPKYLKGEKYGQPIHEIVGRDIGKAKARKLDGDRVTGLLKINAAISDGGMSNVLVLGASKDFAFPFVITKGKAGCYHMVSGELGNAEAIRKTVSTYNPQNPVTSIKIKLIAEGIQQFDLGLEDKTSFTVVSYDMLYDDFFKLKKENGEALGIPGSFDLTIDQMSWVSNLNHEDNSWEDYTESLAQGGYSVSDFTYGGNFSWVLALLGLEKIELVFEKDEHYGYDKANVYKKRERDGEANEFLDKVAIKYHRKTSSVFNQCAKFGIDLDTDAGFVSLASQYGESGQFLMDETESLIDQLQSFDEETFGLLISQLEAKCKIISDNLVVDESESDEDPPDSKITLTGMVVVNSFEEISMDNIKTLQPSETVYKKHYPKGNYKLTFVDAHEQWHQRKFTFDLVE